MIKNTKLALSKAPDKYEKMKILTTLPEEYSVRKIRREFGVSYRMAYQSKKFMQLVGMALAPLKGRAGVFRIW